MIHPPPPHPHTHLRHTYSSSNHRSDQFDHPKFSDHRTNTTAPQWKEPIKWLERESFALPFHHYVQCRLPVLFSCLTIFRIHFNTLLVNSRAVFNIHIYESLSFFPHILSSLFPAIFRKYVEIYFKTSPKFTIITDYIFWLHVLLHALYGLEEIIVTSAVWRPRGARPL